MSKPGIFLLGRHANRTPLSYPAYRALFERYFNYTEDMRSADLVVMGYDVAIKEFHQQLAVCQQLNPSLQLVVLSEEPYWDLVLSNKIFNRHNVQTHSGVEFDYYALNHTTTQIYDFVNFPYFITTEDKYINRYHMLLTQQCRYTAAQIQAIWKSAAYQRAYIAEKRSGSRFDVVDTKHGVRGLMGFRTQVMQAFLTDGNLVQGKGWFDEQRRQSLPDWHLDKLALLNRNSFIISALENTSQSAYITEKLFDAYACLGVPLYYAERNSKVWDLVPAESFINLAGLTAENAVAEISSFTTTSVNMDAYREALSALANKFARPELLFEERQRVVSNVVVELYALI